MTKYAAYDAALLGQIRLAGKPIKTAELVQIPELKSLGSGFVTTSRTLYRVLDARLQFLRRASMIRSTTVGWVVA